MTTEPTGQQALPGLEQLTDEQTRKASELAVAVRRSIAALERMGLIGEVDAARLALALEMADIIQLKKATGRMSTIGNDARVLVDLLDKLLPQATEIDEQLRAAMASWDEATRVNELHEQQPADVD